MLKSRYGKSTQEGQDSPLSTPYGGICGPISRVSIPYGACHMPEFVFPEYLGVWLEPIAALDNTKPLVAAPEPTMWKFILRQGFRRVLDTVSGVQRRHKVTILCPRWHFHAVLDVVYVLEQATLTADNNVVDCRKLLRVFRLDTSLAAERSLGGWRGELYQSDAATVRDHRYAKFLRHEQHRHDLVDAA